MDPEIKLLKQDEAVPESPWIVPRRIDMRLIYLLSIIAPWVGFALFGTSRVGGAEWQNGNVSTYFDLSFADSVWILFAPFLAYSSVAMLLLLWDGPKFSKYWFIRFGIYTGCILAVQFTIQMLPTEELLIGLMVGYFCILPLFGLNWLIGWSTQWSKEKWGKRGPWRLAGGFMSLLILSTLGSIFFGIGNGIFGGLVVGPLAAGVALTPILSGLTAYRLYVYIEKESLKNQLVKIVSGAGWLSAYSVTGAIAIDRVFDLYTQLPTEAPQCYIATASAKGHRPLVNPSAVKMANGEILLVTRQLQILKAGELVLREMAPDMHRAMRRVYDWVGPKLANRVQGPWSADLGYLFFKPFELITMFLLKRLLPNQFRKVGQFYTGR